MTSPIVVVKYGGNAMTDLALQAAFAADVVELKARGLRPVVTHGGGPQISSLLERLGIESEFRGGLRVTSPEAMDVVAMALVGQVQRELVGLINMHGPLAVGISGEDASLFTAERRTATVDGEQVDIGQVGDVTNVRTELIMTPLDIGQHDQLFGAQGDGHSCSGTVGIDVVRHAVDIARDG